MRLRIFHRFLGAAVLTALTLIAGTAPLRAQDTSPATGTTATTGSTATQITPAPVPPTISEKALILYDSSGQFGWLGEVYGRQLANLLGHFKMSYDLRPVEQYGTNGILINSYKCSFYLGSSFDNALPQKFLDDVMTTDKTVCWFHYNLWKIAWAPPGMTTAGMGSNPFFTNRFGFQFNSLDSTPRLQIQYKGQQLTKYSVDPELGWCTVSTDWVNPTAAPLVNSIAPTATTTVPAFACNDQGANCIPYVVHGRNLWYFADMPFSYVTETDRYLVFCDLLYDILGVPMPVERHRAMVRLEDIDPSYDPTILKQMADYLASENIPFSVAVIPVYVDPTGLYNNGRPQTVAMSQTPAFIDAMKYMISKGGTLLMHGYTHQYLTEKNPFTGVSGDDYEFFRVQIDSTNKIIENRTLTEDSWQWVGDRIRAGLKEFQLAGLNPPVAFEPPHYAASPLDYTFFASKFNLTIQRVLYFNYAVGLRGSAFGEDNSPAFFAGQFFPYVIHKDIYGQKVAPENLGNVEPQPWEGLYPARLPSDIVNAAQKNLAVRDGWASFFYHPVFGLDYLKQTVQGIKALGYTFVPLTQDMD